MKSSQLDQKALLSVLTDSVSTYKKAAVLQHEVADRALERLEFMRIEPHVILDYGVRDAYSTRWLQKRYPNAKIMAVDYVEAALSQARCDSPNANINWVHAPFSTVPLANQSVDIIFSNLMLPLIDDIEFCFREFRRLLRPNGLLLFTTLGPDTLKECRDSFATISDYPHVHSFLDMHDIGDAMLACQLADSVVDMEQITMHYASVCSLFRDLKATGMRNVRTDRLRGLMGRRRWQKMLEHYQPCAESGKIPATIEVIYGHAWMGETDSLLRTSVDSCGEVVVPVERIGATERK